MNQQSQHNAGLLLQLDTVRAEFTMSNQKCRRTKGTRFCCAAV